jgi:cell division protein FtsB
MKMARPRKMTTDMMLEIVDDFFDNIADGNIAMLKCSSIAEYAIKLGHSAAAYDFRRNTKVRDKIEDLKTSHGIFGSSKPMVYKNLNISEFLTNNSTIDKLKVSLTELDSYWNSIFEYANKSITKYKQLEKSKKELSFDIRNLTKENQSLADKGKKLTAERKQLVLENRYLKRMLKEHLYPSLANEILRSDELYITDESAIPKQTIEKMTDTDNIKSFNESIAQDKKMILDEEDILKKMWENCDV